MATDVIYVTVPVSRRAVLHMQGKGAFYWRSQRERSDLPNPGRYDLASAIYAQRCAAMAYALTRKTMGIET